MYFTELAGGPDANQRSSDASLRTCDDFGARLLCCCGKHYIYTNQSTRSHHRECQDLHRRFQVLDGRSARHHGWEIYGRRHNSADSEVERAVHKNARCRRKDHHAWTPGQSPAQRWRRSGSGPVQRAYARGRAESHRSASEGSEAGRCRHHQCRLA